MNPTAQPNQFASTGGTPVEGAWYGGQRYMGGQLLSPGQDQPGHTVSADVVAQTNPNNVAFLQSQGAVLPANAKAAADATAANGGGGGMGIPGGNQPNTPNLQSIYDSAYTNNPTVQATTKTISDLNGQITARQQALNVASKNINDNPFYAEATRVGQQAKLTSAANNDINTLTNQLKTAQDSLTNAQAQAERQVNLATGQYSMDNQAYQQTMQQFNTLLSAGGLNNANPSDLASISASTGISTSMLQSIQKTQQAKDSPVQVVTSTDNNGNLSVVAVDKNTGAVVHQETIGGVGKTSTSKSKTSTVADQQQTMSNAIGDITSKTSLASLVAHYVVPGGLTAAQVYSLYNQHSPNGAAKETLAQVQQGQFASNKGFTSKQKATIN